MAEILGTVAGVLSLAIHLTDVLHEYCKGVCDSKSDIEGLIADSQTLAQVLTKLEQSIKEDRFKASQSLATTSTLWVTNDRCKGRLQSLITDLEGHLQGSRTRQISKAMKWPFKAQDTRAISADLHGYIGTFHFALTLDGYQLLSKASEDVYRSLQSSLHSEQISEENAMKTRQILSILTPLSESTMAIRQGVQMLVDEKLLEWLGGRDMSAKHLAIKKKRTVNTGQWFFRTKSYRGWKNNIQPILWAEGKAGAGKSTLMSCVIDRLRQKAGDREGVAVFYCEYLQASDAQTPEIILASLSCQLLRRIEVVPAKVDRIYQRHRRESTRADLSDHIEILNCICKSFSKVWLLIDALDETDRECEEHVMGSIEQLTTSAKIFISSRPRAIDSENIDDKTLRCTIAAQVDDLTIHIETRLHQAAISSRGLRENPGWKDFVHDTVQKLVTLADGMFILVSLQLDMLLGLRSLLEMRKALEIISDKLDDFYADTLSRIKASGSEIPLKVLAWLVKIPVMNLWILQAAVSVQDSQDSVNADAFVPIQDIVPMCCGLVRLGPHNEIALAHATVHEYLSRNLDIVKGFGHMMMYRACMKYVNTSKVSEILKNSKPKTKGAGEAFRDCKRVHPFTEYATRYLEHCYSYFDGPPEDPEELLAYNLCVSYRKFEARLFGIKMTKKDIVKTYHDAKAAFPLMEVA